jgi:hypothetical protein
MSSNFYKNNIKEISEYFGVTDVCAKYLYHRALRSTRKDESYLDWNVALQNALVKADRCLGIEWDKILFGEEEELLNLYGVDIIPNDNTVFRWDVEESEWKVIKKKQKKPMFTQFRIFI